mgnify:CR=1 FL=1
MKLKSVGFKNKNQMNKKKVLKSSLGIDVSKASLSMCLCFLEEDLNKRFLSIPDVSNDLVGFKVLLKRLKTEGFKDVLPLIVMEATGVYHESLAYYFHGKGADVCIMQSGRVKKYAQSLDQRSKTDALDSKMLAMLGCERTTTPWTPPAENLQHLKMLSRERSLLLKEKNSLKNRLHAIETSMYSDKKTLKRFKNRAKLLELQIVEIALEMEDLVSKDKELVAKFKYLESIPGISFISAATVVGETLGFSLINSAKQLTCYAGYDVVLKESGAYRGKPLSKRGNSHIRAIMHMPSMTAVRVNPTLKPFYERLKPKKVKPMVALVAVQRKLLILMYILWKTETEYQADYEQKKAVKIRDLYCAR